jgi:hypothetical protein
MNLGIADNLIVCIPFLFFSGDCHAITDADRLVPLAFASFFVPGKRSGSSQPVSKGPSSAQILHSTVKNHLRRGG